jgi:glycosyltransferase involved in cell wall biosynthesis
MNHTVSFILPALNEARYIQGAIASIYAYSTNLDKYEIIVIDNGSSDGTDIIAQNNGAIVFCMPELSLGAIRNFGASKAQYDHLVFLDSDVRLTPMWQERILQVLDRLTENEFVIAGSTYAISTDPSQIELCWWGQPKEKNRVNYINSGHMIVHRQIFHKLGGFNEQLKSGEDSEFCQRARDVEVKIVHDSDLRVIHEGYPKTLYQFFKRERWHGLGDYNSLEIFARSKPALFSTFQAAMSIVSVVLCGITGNFFWLFIYAALIFPVCLLLAYQRYPAINRCLVLNAYLFFTYFWARVLSLVDAVFRKKFSRKR